MSLFVKVYTSFYTHRKTLRLKAAIGDDAFWVPPKLWAYAADNQPDGDFSGYSDEEVAVLIGYSKDASSMLQALLKAGFIDPDRRIHDWAEHNSYHQVYADRAKNAAKVKWERERQRKEEKIRDEKRGEETSIASSMLQAETSTSTSTTQPEIPLGDTPDKPDHYHKDTRAALHILNEAAGVHYREVDANLSVISARLREPEVTLDGVRTMILRQCKEWKGNRMQRFLRPETLFAKTKFDSYYANRNTPVRDDAERTGAQRFSRSQGTHNEQWVESYKRHQERIALQAAQQVPNPEQAAPGPV